MPKAEDFDLKLEEKLKNAGHATSGGGEDPFAIDFFSQKSEFSVANSFETEPLGSINFAVPENVENSVLWQENLPPVTKREAQISRVYAKIPLDFPDRILRIAEQSISSAILNDSTTVQCELIAVQESDLSSAANLLATGDAVFLNFAAEPSGSLAAIVIDAVHAAQIIEFALNGENSRISERRLLSATELILFEFFAVYFFSSLSREAGEPFCRQISAEQQLPIWLARTNLLSENRNADFQPDSPRTARHQTTRGLTVKIKLQTAVHQGIINLLLPFSFLESFSNKRNPLLLRHEVSKKRGELQKVFTGAPLRVLLGETTLMAEEVAILERNDIILIENAKISRQNVVISGTTHVKIAAEKLGSLYGEVKTDGATTALSFQIREIRQRKIGGAPTRLKMDENILSETAEETGALALEKIAVTMTVELVSRRVTLDELASLRSGQIVDLGCRATDPVELVVDGKTIAVGELVDIEGSLGVRVLRILI